MVTAGSDIWSQVVTQTQDNVSCELRAEHCEHFCPHHSGQKVTAGMNRLFNAHYITQCGTQKYSKSVKGPRIEHECIFRVNSLTLTKTHLRWTTQRVILFPSSVLQLEYLSFQLYKPARLQICLWSALTALNWCLYFQIISASLKLLQTESFPAAASHLKLPTSKHAAHFYC